MATEQQLWNPLKIKGCSRNYQPKTLPVCFLCGPSRMTQALPAPLYQVVPSGICHYNHTMLSRWKGSLLRVFSLSLNLILDHKHHGGCLQKSLHLSSVTPFVISISIFLEDVTRLVSIHSQIKKLFVQNKNSNFKRYMHPPIPIFLAHYLQEPWHGSKLSVHQQMNG